MAEIAEPTFDNQTRIFYVFEGQGGKYEATNGVFNETHCIL